MHQQSESRPANGILDIGAYEFGNSVLQITTASLPNASRARFYNQTLQASGGSNAFVWTVSAGTLPPGMYLDAVTGKIVGKAALKGVWNFTITAQDSQNQALTATKDFTIDVRLY